MLKLFPNFNSFLKNSLDFLKALRNGKIGSVNICNCSLIKHPCHQFTFLHTEKKIIFILSYFLLRVLFFNYARRKLLENSLLIMNIFLVSKEKLNCKEESLIRVPSSFEGMILYSLFLLMICLIMRFKLSFTEKLKKRSF